MSDTVDLPRSGIDLDGSISAFQDLLRIHGGGQAALKPIDAPNVYLIAVSQIAEAINRGYWHPGDRLPPERELSEFLGISRSSVRQALSALEAVGVIHKKPGVGSFVQAQALEIISQEIVSELVTQGDPLMLLEARLLMEPELARLAAARRDESDLEAMETALRSMARFGYDAYSASDFVEADIGLHAAIATASHNPTLVRLYADIAGQMRHRVWLKAALPVVLRRASEYDMQHQRICEAIRAKDGARARRMMLAHLRKIQDNLQSISSITTE